jgi:hypothetical protein
LVVRKPSRSVWAFEQGGGFFLDVLELFLGVGQLAAE